MSDKLAVIVQESGLDKTKAQVLLDNFKDYFQIAGDWEKKAQMIVVTDASQIAEMQMARVGRLFLREKRTHIEHTRKALKEQALREGKAIDGLANVLKALLVPIEEYLYKQEKFVEIKAQEEAERVRIEAEQKAEEERLARIEAERKEQERVRLENERLKKEAEAREKKLREEQAQREAERKKAEAAKKAAEEKARKEREKVEAEKRAVEEKSRQERAKAALDFRLEREKREALEAEFEKQRKANRVNISLLQQLETFCDLVRDYYQNYPEHFTDEKDHKSPTVEELCAEVGDFEATIRKLIRLHAEAEEIKK